MSKKRKKTMPEKAATMLGRELVEDMGYEHEHDWGAVCVSFVKIRVCKEEERVIVKQVSGHRMIGEANDETDPRKDRLLKEAMLQDLERAADTLRKRLAELDEKGVVLDTKVIVPTATNMTNEQMDAAVDSYVAQEEGRLQ